MTPPHPETTGPKECWDVLLDSQLWFQLGSSLLKCWGLSYRMRYALRLSEQYMGLLLPSPVGRDLRLKGSWLEWLLSLGHLKPHRISASYPCNAELCLFGGHGSQRRKASTHGAIELEVGAPPTPGHPEVLEPLKQHVEERNCCVCVTLFSVLFPLLCHTSCWSLILQLLFKEESPQTMKLSFEERIGSAWRRGGTVSQGRHGGCGNMALPSSRG